MYRYQDTHGPIEQFGITRSGPGVERKQKEQDALRTRTQRYKPGPH